MKKRYFKKTQLMFVSPWLLAASIALLCLIIVIFAANNFQRGKRLLTEGLFHKGQMLVRFVGAGSRASMRMGRRGAEQMQHLIEQASLDPDIVYIAVIDGHGRIMAHSDPSLVGRAIDRDLDSFRAITPAGTWHVISSEEDGAGKTFEVVSPFDPFRHGRGRFMRRRMWRMMAPGSGIPCPEEPTPFGMPDSLHSQPDGEKGKMSPPSKIPGDGKAYKLPGAEKRPDSLPFTTNTWCAPKEPGSGDPQTDGHWILIGLDMAEIDTVIRQHRYNILFMSIALLLVGLGGWISLLAAQGYRSSQSTLRHIQAFTGLLIARLPVGIIATDPKGAIKTCNPAAAAMVDKAPENIFNKKPATVLPDALTDFFVSPSEKEEILDQEVVLPVSDNDSRALHVSSVPITTRDNESMGRVLLMHDLSELKKLEQEVRRHDRLVALGKMAAGVAHEVRNPLSSIKGFATLLGSRFAQDSEEQEASRLLVNEVERLNRSITELLNYARPLPLNLVKTDLGVMAQDSLKLISTDAGELKVAIIQEIDPRLPHVAVDQDRLNQVLLNLYLNALQAMEQGGTLTVGVRQGRQPGTVEIGVRDTGCGIPEELLERVLDPYFTTKPEGNGLGLAMVYKIIDEHGGAIHFTSKVNEGTEVVVTLPVR